ncbi:ciliary microtubule associated protein 1A-like [Saccostrea echinata]|uniref:ciliary microtubule associated protein 1A-like n=1 Tax=Saccostrea echinata TaxID=191078 RepID=UPI002A82A58B|nr:ciliary microtubule associated protein 1A-like [Saccostrea echinata]
MAPDIQERGKRKRVLIGAEYTSPGPAQYQLPTTVGQNANDKTKRSTPSFSFGSRHWEFKKEGPGPAYNIDSSLTSRGRDIRPSFSMLGRAKTPKRDVSPGPGAYNTDRAPLKEKNAPHYSISPRTSPRRVDVTPSPNMYALPSTIGPRVPDRKGGTQAALLGRTNYLDFSADLAKTPGPAKYGALPPSQTKRRAPSYSLGARAKTPRDINNVPGPGKYSPEHVTAHLDTSPRYHIGVRHSQYIMPAVPLANVD